MSVWDQIDELKMSFDDSMSRANSAAKDAGYRSVKCSNTLKWTAKANGAAKFQSLKLKDIGPFDSAEELIAAMVKPN